MKAAHEGVPVAGLPVGTWRSAEAQNPDASADASAQPHRLADGDRRTRRAPAAAGAPPEAFTPQPRVAGPRGARPTEDGGLLPPAEIPNGGRGPPARDKGLLDKLFGTL